MLFTSRERFRALRTTAFFRENEYYWVRVLKSYLENNKKLKLMFQWLLMYALSRFIIVRRLMKLVSQKNQSQVNSKDKSHSSIFDDLNTDYVINLLKTEGFCIPFSLPDNIIKEVLNFARISYLHGNGDSNIRFRYGEKKYVESKQSRPFIISNYEDASLCPAIKKIANDPKLLEIANKYLGAEPICKVTRLWWSFPVEATPDELIKVGQVFHYDLDDYNALNFFFYLTDVDSTSGPHVCIRGSHTNKKFSHQLALRRRRSDEEMIDYYGAENILAIDGKAGLGIVEDPFCFHKGTLPSSKERLTLQITFTLNSY
jgi:hypothetical protein